MRLYEVIWKESFVDKIERKHRVTPEEVEQVLFSKPHLCRAEKGRSIQGEDLYVAYVKQQQEDTLWCFSFINTRGLHCQFPLVI